MPLPTRLSRASTNFIWLHSQIRRYGQQHRQLENLQFSISDNRPNHLSKPLVPIIKSNKPNPNSRPYHLSRYQPSSTSKNAIHTQIRNYSTNTPSSTTPTRILAGKTALISGGSRGIGLAIAQRFALSGANCILLGREEVTLKKALESLSSSSVDSDSTTTGENARMGLQRHSFRSGDIRGRDFWVKLGKDDEVKNSSILINAAGITHNSLLIHTQPALLESIIQTNLMGTIWSCQIMTKQFLRKKGGCIINISSLLGIKGGVGSTVYAASKAGVIGLTRSLAAEVAPLGVRVNAILPGYIDTNMTDAMGEKAHAKALESIPLGRFGTTAEVADAALFLATNQYATNCVLNLDGGLSAT